MQKIDYYLDLRKEHLDLEDFAAALALRHIRRLIAYGGCAEHSSTFEQAIHPTHLETFLTRVVNTIQLTRHFSHEWNLLLHSVPLLREAWEQGHMSFREDLQLVRESQEEQEDFAQIDLAHNCYAYVNASYRYSEKKALQAWFMHGYMLAWRSHFM